MKIVCIIIIIIYEIYIVMCSTYVPVVLAFDLEYSVNKVMICI